MAQADVTWPTQDQMEQAVLQDNVMMGFKDVTIPPSVARVLVVGLAVPNTLTSEQREALRVAIAALPNVQASLLLTNHPVKHYTNYTTSLHVNSQIIPKIVPVAP